MATIHNETYIKSIIIKVYQNTCLLLKLWCLMSCGCFNLVLSAPMGDREGLVVRMIDLRELRNIPNQLQFQNCSMSNSNKYLEVPFPSLTPSLHSFNFSSSPHTYNIQSVISTSTFTPHHCHHFNNETPIFKNFC